MDIKYWSEFEISIMREERDYVLWESYMENETIQVNSHYSNVYLTTEYIPQSHLVIII